MAQVDLGWEVIEARLANYGIEIKIEKTEECLKTLERVWTRCLGDIDIINEEYEMLRYIEGEGPGYVVTKEGEVEELIYMQGIQEESWEKFYKKRKEWIKNKNSQKP